MTTRHRRTLMMLAAGALLLCAAPPADASGDAPGFDLQLEMVLTQEAPRLDLGANRIEPAAAEIASAGPTVATPALPSAPRISALRLANVRGQVWSQNDGGSAAQGGSKTRRFGRWMKRHWWAPALVGVAVGVVLLEPFDDDKIDDPQ